MFPAGYLLISILLGTVNVNADVISKQQLRNSYYAAVKDSDKTERLYSILSASDDNSPLKKAYIGGLTALKAKHDFNPIAKLRYLSDAERIMQAAISESPNDIEIRFLRFSYQYHVPRFLGFSDNLQEDKEVIVEQILSGNYGESDRDLVKNVIDFLLRSKECSNEEASELNKFN